MPKSYGRLKAACYVSNICMSIVGNLSPLLFLTFREEYGISYSLLGLLVLINFTTQLLVDLAFSFFSHRFNIPLAVRIIPVLTVIGLGVYALWPVLLPGSAYVGLVIGTVIFSASSGLAEVLISPVIAAIPAENTDRELSRLHSVYAWGVVGLILTATVFLQMCGHHNWPYLVALLCVVPLTAMVLFSGTEIPAMDTPERVSGVLPMLKNAGLWAAVAGIFCGGAAELCMAQWSSGYLEQALGIPKVWGDVCGVALFSVMLGLGRSLYASRGRHIGRVLTLGACGAVVCYLTAVFTSQPLVGLAACALTGLCVSMLWPGSLVAVADRFPSGGVFIYAMMAAGGDLGGSVGPQLVGVITDSVMANPTMIRLAGDWGLTPEQMGMKAGLLVGMVFPLLAIPLFAQVWRRQKRAAR